jgi:outer membrane protein TolC
MRAVPVLGATIFVVFTSVPVALAEGDELGDPLQLPAVIDYARAHNPDIRAAASRARAAAFMPAQVRALDDPTFSHETWNMPNSMRIDRADNNIFRVSQKLPFPGKRRLAAEVSERDADVSRHAAAGTELDTVTDVKRAYFDLWEAHEKLLVYSREKEIFQRFAGLTQHRYGTGDVTQSDVLRAQTEVTGLINRVSTGSLAIDSARVALNALLSRAPGAPLATPEELEPPRLDFTVGTLMEKAMQNRPELAAQSAAIAREEAAIELAHRNYWPDFEVNVSRFVNSEADDGFGVMATISIPFVYRSKYDAAVSEAAARLDTARAERRRLEDGIGRDVQQAFLRARTAELKHNLHVTTHIPQAEQSLRVTEAAYEAGSVDLLALLDTARAIEMIHLDHIEAAADFERAVADLERAIGTDLGAHHAGKMPNHTGGQQ